MYSQAAKILAKLGGPRRVAPLIGKTASAVYRWTYPKERGGTDGLVPTSEVKAVLDAADLMGVELTGEDWRP